MSYSILVFVYIIVYIFKQLGLKSIFIKFFFQFKVPESKIIIPINLINGPNLNKKEYYPQKRSFLFY